MKLLQITEAKYIHGGGEFPHPAVRIIRKNLKQFLQQTQDKYNNPSVVLTSDETSITVWIRPNPNTPSTGVGYSRAEELALEIGKSLADEVENNLRLINFNFERREGFLGGSYPKDIIHDEWFDSDERQVAEVRAAIGGPYAQVWFKLWTNKPVKRRKKVTEAKHASYTTDDLANQLADIVYNTFEEIYIGDFSNHEDYTDTVITKILKRVEETLPIDLRKTFTDAIWSAYHSFDESEFADTESLVDAMVNEIAQDVRWWAHRVAL
jgi:hypothetical protein